MNEDDTPDHAAPREKFWTLSRRRWAYGVMFALGAAAVTFGKLTGEENAAILAVGGALLGVTGLAVANPTKD